jgi:predicted metalloprotease with PDZ domain
MTIRYLISCPNPHRQFVHFSAVFPTEGKDTLTLQLPAWRPGRYELGNFARNLRAVRAEDENGRPLKHRKVTKDRWEAEAKGAKEVRWFYEYYAAELNAGSSWLDETQLYLNPVNCFFFNPEKPEAEFELRFDLPPDFEIATGMPADGHHGLKAAGVQQLMDCPLIAAADLIHWEYECEGIPFHIWFKGDIKLNREKLIREFRTFTEVQIRAFEGFPVSEYHFLFQVPDFAVRHGVEHENSTVIAIGPPELLATRQWYDELIGISSHELYHTWNVKSLRPADMVPYDFTRENYSRMGYVAEGVTTYMGDQMLLRSGYFSLEEFLTLFTETLQRHLDNPGRFNLSVADSSFDTWLDGYQPGIPWRKVSIYNEGCLTAFMTDVLISVESGGKHSLDTVMQNLWNRCGKKGKGITEDDYRNEVAKAAGRDLTEVFDDLIDGVEDYLPLLARCCQWLGWEIKGGPAARYTEAFWGVKSENNRITSVLPDSPADAAGLWVGDSIIAVDGRTCEGDWDALARHMGKGIKTVMIKRHGKLKTVKVRVTNTPHYLQVKVTPVSKPNSDQKSFYLSWKR